MIFDLFNRKADKLRVFNASENHLESIASQRLLNTANLESLDLSHNRIARINPYTFVYSAKFKYLNLSYNQLTKLDVKVFDRLRSLEVFHLDHNEIKQITGNFTNFKHTWKELYLQNNMLLTLDPFLVRSISILDLSENKISEVRFHGSKLIELKISRNDLKVLTIGDNLEKLDASWNTENFFFVDFTNSKNMKQLDLTGSRFSSKKQMIDTIMTLKKLTHLNLADITFAFKEGMFNELKDLEELNLNDCFEQVEGFPNNTFNHMTKLKRLGLAYIHYQTLDLTKLAELKELENIDLRYCYASNLIGWQNISELLPKLKDIGLYNNRFECNETKLIIKDFKAKGIKVDELEEYGEQQFSAHCRMPYDFSNSDTNKSGDQTHESGLKKSHKFIGWFVGILIFCIVIGGLVVMHRRFNIFSRSNGPLYRSSALANDEI